MASVCHAHACHGWEVLHCRNAYLSLTAIRALQALAELSRRMANSTDGAPDMVTQQWFLRDRKFDVNAAIEKLDSMMRWRREFK